MFLSRVDANNFRIFEQLTIELERGIHVIYGDNAAGKTTILEIIHYLCSCKSFLNHPPRKLVKKNNLSFSISGSFSDDYSSFQTNKISWENNQIFLSLGFEKIYKTSEYAAFQPVLAIGPFSHQIIDNAPEIRRKFIDWGVFHVKHNYSAIVRQFSTVLMQRNIILKERESFKTIHSWDQEFESLSNAIDIYRTDYLKEFNVALKSVCKYLLPDHELSIKYQRGWDFDVNLSEILKRTLETDIARGFTYYGPQRADFAILLNNQNIKDIASRGQKKIISFALYLAQITLLTQLGKRKPVLLIDDLPSELDKKNIKMVHEILVSMDMQVLITSISPELLFLEDGEVSRMFHVEQGGLRKVI